MNVLVLGSGGREHALAWAIAKSPTVERLIAAPGNPGTAALGACQNVAVDPMDFEAVLRLVVERSIDLVVVGAENPLAAGIADYLRERRQGLAVFGPGAGGARLESSKSFAKEFMVQYGIPHASYRVFSEPEEASNYIRSTGSPWVLKADGLALGKGVSIVEDEAEALSVIRQFMVEGVHGEAGKRIVIEEYLTGPEVTAMALCDGKTIWPLPLAKDHKRVFDGDMGPMTGGMGAFSPVPFVSDQVEGLIREQILDRALAGLIEEGIDYRGVIYAGLMLTGSGPKVLEFNVRFGDPEVQCVLPRIEGDFAAALFACAEGRLITPISVKPQACAAIVLASGGYPGAYQKGFPVTGLDELPDGVVAFHAGTAEQRLPGEGRRLVTSGGRVLALAALGETVLEARDAAYRAAAKVQFDDKQYRRDIGLTGEES